MHIKIDTSATVLFRAAIAEVIQFLAPSVHNRVSVSRGSWDEVVGERVANVLFY